MTDRQLKYAMTESARLEPRREAARKRKLEAFLRMEVNEIEQACAASWAEKMQSYKVCTNCAGEHGDKTCILVLKDETTPCFHGFCLTCVKLYLKTKHRMDMRPTCPYGCGELKKPFFQHLEEYCHELMYAGGAGEFMVTEAGSSSAGSSSAGAGPSSAGADGKDASAHVAAEACQEDIQSNHAAATAAYVAAAAFEAAVAAAEDTDDESVVDAEDEIA